MIENYLKSLGVTPQYFIDYQRFRPSRFEKENLTGLNLMRFTKPPFFIH